MRPVERNANWGITHSKSACLCRLIPPEGGHLERIHSHACWSRGALLTHWALSPTGPCSPAGPGMPGGPAGPVGPAGPSEPVEKSTMDKGVNTNTGVL